MILKVRALGGWWLVCLLSVIGLLAASSDLRLVDAVQMGDKDAVRSLLEQHADVNLPQADGATALAWAVHRDDMETAELLIRAGSDVNAANDYGVTPLALACMNRNGAMVERLLQAGAKANAAQWTGETVLMTCASTGSVEGVKLLLARGADANAAENRKGQTALMWAAAERHPEVVRALVEKGADVHARSKVIPTPEPFSKESTNIFGSSYARTVHFPKMTGGFTALLFAAQQGDVESARILLAAGANVNDSTPEDGSALVVATASGHEKLALFLLEKGADPNAKDGYGIAPLHYALHEGLLVIAGARRSETDRFGWLRPDMPELVKGLLAHGADPNARIEKNLPTYDHPFIARSNGNDHPQIDLAGATPLVLAAASGDVGSMRILVEGRADPKLATPEGVTPLLAAAGLGTERGIREEKSALEAAKLAVLLGADVNATKEDGRTALHAAASLGWNDMIQFLAEKGANLDAKDIYGQTPLTIALGDPEGLIYRQLPGGRYDDRFRNPRPGGQKDTAELLLKLGATPFTGKARDRSGE
jgi:ankyrin repeat protein